MPDASADPGHEPPIHHSVRSVKLRAVQPLVYPGNIGGGRAKRQFGGGGNRRLGRGRARGHREGEPRGNRGKVAEVKLTRGTRGNEGLSQREQRSQRASQRRVGKRGQGKQPWEGCRMSQRKYKRNIGGVRKSPSVEREGHPGKRVNNSIEGITVTHQTCAERHGLVPSPPDVSMLNPLHRDTQNTACLHVCGQSHSFQELLP